jgi:hypothetical protein
MFPFSSEEIGRLDENNIQRAEKFDSAGLLPAPGENVADFKARMTELKKVSDETDSELSSKGVYNLLNMIELRAEDRIPAEIISEAAEITDRLYGFRIEWVPGFFLSKGLGPLWGGCAVFIPEKKMTFFLIRSSFRKAVRWFIYRRDELLAHELCHSARMPLKDRIFEEHFAYRTAFSAFRRYAGNCFRTAWDSIFFILPIFILLAVRLLVTFAGLSLPVWPFWIFAMAYPFFLFTRNQRARYVYFRAEKKLREAGTENPGAVLFRCTKDEIVEISGVKGNNKLRTLLDSWIKNRDLRWKITGSRFIK